MIIGIGTPSSQSKIPLPMMCSLYWSGDENAIIPCAVAQRATLSRRKARRECAEQHGGGQPEGKLCRAFARGVGGGLRFDDHVIDALLRIGLAHAGASSHDLRHIGFVGGGEILIALKLAVHNRRTSARD